MRGKLEWYFVSLLRVFFFLNLFLIFIFFYFIHFCYSSFFILVIWLFVCFAGLFYVRFKTRV